MYIIYQFLLKSIFASSQQVPERDTWLVMRQHLGANFCGYTNEPQAARAAEESNW